MYNSNINPQPLLSKASVGCYVYIAPLSINRTHMLTATPQLCVFSETQNYWGTSFGLTWAWI